MNTPAIDVLEARKLAVFDPASASVAATHLLRQAPAAAAAVAKPFVAAGQGIKAWNNAPPAEAADLSKYKAMLAPKKTP